MATLKSLFASLEAGDLLIVPLNLPGSQEKLTAHAAVLRVGDAGELCLSRLSDERPDSRPETGNPYRWSDREGALVGADGTVPVWYSVNIQLERRGASEVARQYAAVPQFDQCRHRWNTVESKRFEETDPRYPVLAGIATHGKAGGLGTQLSLALDVMGVPHDKAQAIGLGLFVEKLAEERSRSAWFAARFFDPGDVTL